MTAAGRDEAAAYEGDQGEDGHGDEVAHGGGHSGDNIALRSAGLNAGGLLTGGDGGHTQVGHVAGGPAQAGGPHTHGGIEGEGLHDPAHQEGGDEHADDGAHLRGGGNDAVLEKEV